MWYAGWGAVFSQYVGFAESSDGITWTKPPGNPILGPGTAAAWDGEEVFSPCAIQDGPTLKLWYGAESQAGFSARIGYATNP